MFYIVITRYCEFMTGRIITTRKKFTDCRDAREEFCKALYNPDCMLCNVITESRQIIMHFEERDIDL